MGTTDPNCELMRTLRNVRGPLLTKSASDQLWLEVLGKESPATGVPDAGL